MHAFQLRRDLQLDHAGEVDADEGDDVGDGQAVAGQPSFKATRRRASEHGIEDVGARLRAMMPWISKNKLVDTSRN